MKLKKYIAVFTAFFLLSFTKAQLFTEVSDIVGLDYNYPGITNMQIGGGVTVFDYNNDGWDDIFQAGGLFPSVLWKNERGKFKAVNEQHDMQLLKGMYINGAVAGDVNNDGWEDLFIYNYSEGQGHGDGKNLVLLINDHGFFRPAENAGFAELGFYTSATMADVNDDGFLDIYVTNYVKQMSLLEDSLHYAIGYIPVGLPNRLYINNGNETFSEMAKQYNVADDGCGLAACFSDIDNDGKAELLLANDFGEWTNKGNKLYKATAMFNLLTDESDYRQFNNKMYGMSIAPGDIDGDGDLDFFISNIGKNILLENNNGVFKNVSDTNGFADAVVKDGLPGTAWSALFFDLDGDGDLDLYLAKGNVENYIPKAVILDPNQLYENIGNGKYKEIKNNTGLDCPLSHRGAALIDFDNDGDMDIVSSPIKIGYGAFSGLSQKIKLYRNNSLNKNFIKVQLVDDMTGKSTVGVQVLLKQESNIQLRVVDGGGAHASQSSKTLQFTRINNHTPINFNVRWGQQTVSYTITDFKNKKIMLYKSGKIQ